MTCCGLNDSSLRTCNFLEHEFSHTRVACPPCLRNWSRGTGAAKNIDATYGFHSARIVEYDRSGNTLRVLILWVFCGSKKFFVLGSEFVSVFGNYQKRRTRLLLPKLRHWRRGRNRPHLRKWI